MSTNFKKTYKFAGYTSAAITVVLTLGLGVFFYASGSLNLYILTGFAILCYLSSFFIIQYRVERFIYKRIKKIYDDVSLLEASSFSKNQITTDMATLTKEVERFAQDKKLEIEGLKIRT